MSWQFWVLFGAAAVVIVAVVGYVAMVGLMAYLDHDAFPYDDEER